MVGAPRFNRFLICPLYQKAEDEKKWLEPLETESLSQFDFGFVLKADGALIGTGGLVFHTKLDGSETFQAKNRSKIF